MIAAGAWEIRCSPSLSSCLEAGDRIAVDRTYPNFITLANLLYLQLVPIEMMPGGMCLELAGKCLRAAENQRESI